MCHIVFMASNRVRVAVKAVPVTHAVAVRAGAGRAARAVVACIPRLADGNAVKSVPVCVVRAVRMLPCFVRRGHRAAFVSTDAGVAAAPGAGRAARTVRLRHVVAAGRFRKARMRVDRPILHGRTRHLHLGYRALLDGQRRAASCLAGLRTASAGLRRRHRPAAALCTLAVRPKARQCDLQHDGVNMYHVGRDVDIALGRRVLVGVLLDAAGVERRAALPVELLDARGPLKLSDDRSHVRAAVGDGQLRVPRLRDGLGIVDLPHPRPNRQPVVAIDNPRHASCIESIQRFSRKDRYIFTGHSVTDMRIAAQLKRRASLRQQRRRVGDGRIHIWLADHAPECLRRAVDVRHAAVHALDVQLVHALTIAQRIKARRKVRVEDLFADLLHVPAIPQLRRVGIVRPHDVQRPRVARCVRRHQCIWDRLNQLEQRRKQSFARKAVLVERRKVAAPQCPARRLLARQHLPDAAFQRLSVAADLHVGRRNIV